jgi:hypothetical protein
MDALSPVRGCDPWAVHIAKSFVKDHADNLELNRTQQAILDILKGTDGVAPDLLAQRLNLKRSDLEREIAALRHMEKIKAGLRNGTIIICLW